MKIAVSDDRKVPARAELFMPPFYADLIFFIAVPAVYKFYQVEFTISEAEMPAETGAEGVVEHCDGAVLPCLFK